MDAVNEFRVNLSVKTKIQHVFALQIYVSSIQKTQSFRTLVDELGKRTVGFSAHHNTRQPCKLFNQFIIMFMGCIFDRLRNFRTAHKCHLCFREMRKNLNILSIRFENSQKFSNTHHPIKIIIIKQNREQFL